MAVTEIQAQRAAEGGRDDVYDLWRKNFTDVARDQKNLSLDSVPATFKNAAAIGLGMSATTLMFPEAAKKVTGAIAVPLTLVNMAMTAYQTTYAENAKRENMLLNNTYCLVT